jgi:hypothetical protein
MRLWAGVAISSGGNVLQGWLKESGGSLGSGNLSGHFGGKVVHLLLDAASTTKA